MTLLQFGSFQRWLADSISFGVAPIDWAVLARRVLDQRDEISEYSDAKLRERYAELSPQRTIRCEFVLTQRTQSFST